MKELLEYIVKSIVNNPDQVQVTERESVDFPGLTILAIDVAEGDLGVLIGKKGRTINAIRDIITIAAIRSNKRVRVMVNENGREEMQSASTSAPVDTKDGEVMADQSVEDTLDL